MKLRDFGLLTDECLDAAVVKWLEGSGFDVLDVCRDGLRGVKDVQIIRRATQENRLVVTHDADFGTLAITQGESIVGIIYLRPGHIDPTFTIDTLASLLDADPDVTSPIVLVARRQGNSVAIRIRSGVQ